MSVKETLLSYKEKFHKEFNLIPVLGCELEFYSSSSEPVIGLDVVKEDGHNQFEIRLGPTEDIFQLLKDISDAKKNLKKCGGMLAAKPFEHQPGSALQIHLNFIPPRAVSPLPSSRRRPGPSTATIPPKGWHSTKDDPFGGSLIGLGPGLRRDDGIGVEQALDYAIGGLLHTMPDFMIFFAPHEDSYKRFEAKSMTTPTTISWGPNNRTAALRLLKDFNKVPRIEHRVAGADADPAEVIMAILLGSYIGIKEKLPPIKPTYGLAFDPQYNLALLPASLAEAKKNFTTSRFSSMFASLV